jgi:hypothetical protein
LGDSFGNERGAQHTDSGQPENHTMHGRAHKPDPSSDLFQAIWEEEWQRHILASATKCVKQSVCDPQFQIFDLHVLRGWSTADVARILRVSRTQIYLAKLRVGRRFKQQLDSLNASAETYVSFINEVMQ